MGSVEITRRDGCGILTLCNAPRRNALNHAMLASLREALTTLAGDASCHAVVIEGQGAHFCAGRDISELSSAEALSDDDLRADFDKLRTLFTALHAFPKPLISVVRGYALGLGAALICFSDIVLADTTARLGIPEVKVGVAPSITTVVLMRAVPSRAAARLLFTGAIIDAPQARDFGLVSEVVQPDALAPAVAKVLEELQAASPSAVSLCKRLMRTVESADFPTSLDHAIDLAIGSLRTPDALEGRRAFLEKRKPNWV
jgi:enoyl-CoA hydratase/carnithine racemase